MRADTRKRALTSDAHLSPAEIALVRSLVLFQDEQVLALNKPAGLSSQGGRGQVNTLDELLYAFAKSSGRRPVLVHRLDRDTSGVILAARTKPAASFLGKAMIARRFGKTYLALIAAPPEPRSGEITVPLRRDEIGREAYTVVADSEHPGAEAALTRYRTLAAAERGALVEARPETGRMHQIRVHLAHLGRPIAGDSRYGGALMLSGRAVPRLMLHAAVLSFPHPGGGRFTIKAPPPADFLDLAAALGVAQALDQLRQAAGEPGPPTTSAP
jgi:tRNA pseudouridine32 synthase/23S rRNA pseudouridine746 synthase